MMANDVKIAFDIWYEWDKSIYKEITRLQY